MTSPGAPNHAASALSATEVSELDVLLQSFAAAAGAVAAAQKQQRLQQKQQRQGLFNGLWAAGAEERLPAVDSGAALLPIYAKCPGGGETAGKELLIKGS